MVTIVKIGLIIPAVGQISQTVKQVSAHVSLKKNCDIFPGYDLEII